MKSPEASANAKQQSTVRWVVAIAAIALIFDGYDLVVYGTIVSTLLGDPTQLGEIGPATAGVLGSWALFGVMVGALVTGAVGDYLGRRKIMITGIVWFSMGMGLTSLANTVMVFGSPAFRHRARRRGTGGNRRRGGGRVRPQGQTQLLQRRRLFRCPGGRRPGIAAGHRPDGPRRLAGAVPHRCNAPPLPTAHGTGEAARVTRMADGPRPHRGSPARLDPHRRPSLRTGTRPEHPRACSRARGHQDRFPCPGFQEVRDSHPVAGSHEFRRPAADIRAEHLASADHVPVRLRQVLFALVPAGAQCRCRHSAG